MLETITVPATKVDVPLVEVLTLSLFKTVVLNKKNMNVLLLFSRKDNDSKDLFSYIVKSETLRQNIFPICGDG